MFSDGHIILVFYSSLKYRTLIVHKDFENYLSDFSGIGFLYFMDHKHSKATCKNVQQVMLENVKPRTLSMKRDSLCLNCTIAPHAKH